MSRPRVDQRNMHLRDGLPGIALAPSLEATVALLCGCISTGRFSWQGAHPWRIFCVWLAIDVALGCALRCIIALKVTLPSSLSDCASGGPAPTLPFALPRSPGQRLVNMLAQYAPQRRNRVRSDALYNGMTAVCAVGMMLVLMTFLGRDLLAVASLVLLGVVVFSIVAGPHHVRLTHWFAGLHVAAAWVLGVVALAPLRLQVVGIALLIGMGTAALPCRWAQRGRYIEWFARVCWWGAVAVLLATRQPILAAIVAVIALAGSSEFAQMPVQRLENSWALGRGRWMFAQIVVALAMANWA